VKNGRIVAELAQKKLAPRIPLRYAIFLGLELPKASLENTLAPNSNPCLVMARDFMTLLVAATVGTSQGLHPRRAASMRFAPYSQTGVLRSVPI
jgi:hypothetical protein